MHGNFRRRRGTRLASALALALVAAPIGAAGTARDAAFASFRRPALPEELPARLTTAFAEDHDGFLWMGTQHGLVRFDGGDYRLFTSDPDDPATLSGSYVRALAVADDGRLWVGTFAGGLSVYDARSERFTRYRHDPADPASLAHDRVEGIAPDRDGRIWIATYDGLDRLDPTTGAIEHFRPRPGDPASLADARVRGVLVDAAGTLWVGSRDGLQRRPAGAAGFERVASAPGRPGSLAGQFVSRLFADRRGRLWIGTNDDGAALLDPDSGELVRFPPPAGPGGGAAAPGAAARRLSHFWVYGFAEPRPDEIWIATFGGGVDVVDGATLEVVARLRHEPALPSTIAGDRVGALHVDRAGLVWVGSWGQGIARHDPATRAFVHLRHSPSRPDGLTHDSVVRPLARRDGSFWFGTNGNGIDVFDGTTLARVAGFRPDPGDPRALSSGEITCLAEGPDGSVWAATLDGNLHRLRPAAAGFERTTPHDGLPGGPIRALAFGPDGALWAGAAEGLARIDPSGAAPIRTFRHRAGAAGSLPGAAVEAIAFTPDGAMWVGTDSGLSAWDPLSGTGIAIHEREGDPGALPDDWVPDLAVTSDGRLWVATAGGAAVLASWDGRDARFERVAERTGIPPGPVENLIEDAEGRVWLGPHVRVDPRSWTAQTYSAADGVDPGGSFIASHARAADGRLLFGSPQGVLIVDPARLEPWTFRPPLVATRLAAGGVELAGAARRGEVTLRPPARDLRLDFAALDWSAPERNLYRYRLDGLDRDWTATDAAHRTAAYSRLPPGRYVLRVAGTNRAGTWSPHELALAVTVLPAFHETTAFRALAAIALALLAWGAHRLRIRRLEARERELEGVVAARTAELAQRGRELEAKNAELEVAYARIEEASLTDPLTGLANRRFLEQAIGADVEAALRRPEDGSLIFLLADLDHFKRVNDEHGHAGGDAVLVAIAALLRANVRAADHLVRWGGEELLMVARFVDPARGPELAEKLRATVAAHRFVLPSGVSLSRTVSIGFAAFPFSPSEPRAAAWEAVVDAADAALYAAKRAGRDGWVGVAPAADRPVAAVLARLAGDPAAAVAAGDVEVVTSFPTTALTWQSTETQDT
ncbi:MAG: hypothetical protein AMXMBFR36_15370 [Acidobacteriota bacterium]